MIVQPASAGHDPAALAALDAFLRRPVGPSKQGLVQLLHNEPRLAPLIRDPETVAYLNNFLTDDERKTVAEVRARSPLWMPLPGPQTAAYTTPADELYYGGAAGGGKSDLLIGLGTTAHKASIIFRREFPQLKQIIRRAKQIIGQRVQFNMRSGWEGIKGGRILELGAVQYEDDVDKYKGRPHDLICVGRGTPVRMADGTYCPIEQVRIGDYVATLEGAQRVTRTMHMGVKECVRVTVRRGGQVHSQVQSRGHALLTTDGWVSYDTWCGLPRPLISAPMLRRAARISAEWSSRRCVAPAPVPSSPRAGLPQLEGFAQYLAGHQSAWGLPAETALSGRGSGYGAWSVTRPTALPQALCLPLWQAPRQPSPWLDVSLTPDLTCGRDDAGAPPASSPLGCQGGCSCGTHPRDARPRRAATVALLCPPQSGGAAGQSPTGFADDGRAGTPIHSRYTQEYAHPYTGETRQIRAAIETSSLDFTPVGEQEVFDLTIEGGNHYITGAGFINRNCFDELPDFTELQYLFLTGWLRTPIPGQRTRIVGAGNPPTKPEGLWVIQRWAPWLDPAHAFPAEPGELRWYARIEDMDVPREDGKPFRFRKETIYPKSRTFIPAFLKDNPFYANDPQYTATLQSLPEPFRSQLLKGDFSVGIEDPAWQVIPTKWVQMAQERWKRMREHPGPLMTVGIDVARGGKAKTVFAPRHGGHVGMLHKLPGRETPDGPSVRDAFLKWMSEDMQASTPPVLVQIDVLGVGASAYDHLVGAQARVNPVNFGDPSYATDRSGQLFMRNLRAEAYWMMREALDPANGFNIQLPPDAELLADLCAPHWTPTPQGVLIEEKKEVAKRIGRSPDCGDAVVMAFIGSGIGQYIAPQPPVVVGARSVSLPGQNRGMLPRRGGGRY